MSTSAALQLSETPTVLMCAPKRFNVLYEINQFMYGNCGMVDPDRAYQEWQDLYAAVQNAGARIELLHSQAQHPDFVFTANGGFVWGQSVVLPRFAHPERQGEEPHFREWFASRGYELIEVRETETFEGEGDVVVFEDLVFMGTHARTSPGAAKTLEKLTGLEVIPLQLDPDGFYHLDTCMFSAGDSLFFCPDAFSVDDCKVIRERIDGHKQVQVTFEEANRFACNTVVLGDTAISPLCPPSFAKKLEDVGFRSVMVDLSEFLKAGGAAKCLVLRLD